MALNMCTLLHGSRQGGQKRGKANPHDPYDSDTMDFCSPHKSLYLVAKGYRAPKPLVNALMRVQAHSYSGSTSLDMDIGSLVLVGIINPYSTRSTEGLRDFCERC